MAEKPLQTLHRALIENNYDVPEDYSSFERTLTAKGDEGYNNRYTLWKSLKQTGYDVPDSYESFRNTLFSPVQPRQATRPQTPRGFGQLNMDQARRPTFMSQKPTEEPIDVPQEESIVDKTQRQISGNATPEENRQVQNRMQQRMDEIAYEQETGKRMSQASDIPFTAPTLARDEYGNIRHNDDGNVLTGITTDEDRVSAHQQVVQEQKEWDALSDMVKTFATYAQRKSD
jgi:hypothetical protein